MIRTLENICHGSPVNNTKHAKTFEANKYNVETLHISNKYAAPGYADAVNH